VKESIFVINICNAAQLKCQQTHIFNPPTTTIINDIDLQQTSLFAVAFMYFVIENLCMAQL
jgi:hypothetical protein